MSERKQAVQTWEHGRELASMTGGGTTYYYATNLQGDVVAILDGSGTAVVSYTYDAWGNVLSTTGSLASTLGTHNPLRYRGYVYDAETELYYLQSRYYDPTTGRFINADGYVSTGQGFIGCNMFAYCNNNPVRRVDPSGQFWEELWDAFTQALQQASGYFVAAAGVTQADSPVPGPADVAGAVMALGGLFACAAIAVGTTIFTAPKTQSSFGSGQTAENAVHGELGSIASSFGNFRCKEAAESMVDYLKKNDQHGEIITITYVGGRGYIWSDIRGKTISNNGIHVGVKYKGMVYCNVHPLGLPEMMWVNDFHGTGTKVVTKTPF